jgi:hypothetical protein
MRKFGVKGTEHEEFMDVFWRQPVDGWWLVPSEGGQGNAVSSGLSHHLNAVSNQ